MISKNKQRLEKERNKLFEKKKNKVLELYNRGYTLGKISRNSLIDFSTVLNILRRSRIKRNVLYKTYEKQITYIEDSSKDIIMETDKPFIDKFFPGCNNENFDASYFWYWKKKYGDITKKRKTCLHKIRNITCANCGAVLKDASDIPI
jgi:hypothetical protein